MIQYLNAADGQGSATSATDDVIIEILSRLPLKTLLKMKSVCKRWHHLISDPVFISDYSRRNSHQRVYGFYLQKLFYLQLYSELVFVAFDGQINAAPEASLCFIKDEYGVFIRHSCNGLLICSSFRCTEEERRYYICSPTTKQYFEIPSPNCQTVFGINIVCDLEYSHHYQVICVCNSIVSSRHRQIIVYERGTKSWRSSGEPFRASDALLFDRGVYWRGSLHWVGTRKLSFRFDIKKELLHKLPMPPIQKGREGRRFSYFNESGGHLYLIQHSREPAAKFDVLELKTDYSGWFKKYQVNLEASADRNGRIYGICSLDLQNRFSIMHIIHRRAGEKEESLLIMHIMGKLVFYDLENEMFAKVDDILHNSKSTDEYRGFQFRWEDIFPYNNSPCYLYGF